jgi:hypothetical protein
VLAPRAVEVAVSNETERQKPAVEEAVPDELILGAAAHPEPKKKKRTKKPTAVGAGTTAGTTAAAAEETTTGTGMGDANETGEGSTPDDGIDWSVPDFPEEPPAAANSSPTEPAVSPPPSKPRPPTGTPDVPAQNPVVIDEPPAR